MLLHRARFRWVAEVPNGRRAHLNNFLQLPGMAKIRNLKSEIRTVAEPQSDGLARLGCRDGSRKVCCSPGFISPKTEPSAALRISDFGFPSDFGFRVSDLPPQGLP